VKERARVASGNAEVLADCLIALMTERDSEDARAGALVLAETAQTIIRIGHALKG